MFELIIIIVGLIAVGVVLSSRKVFGETTTAGPDEQPVVPELVEGSGRAPEPPVFEIPSLEPLPGFLEPPLPPPPSGQPARLRMTIPATANFDRLISAIAIGIARAEGFYARGTRPSRNHNPGDLRDTDNQFRFPKDPAKYVIFPDDSTGWRFLFRDVRIKFTNRSKTGFTTADTIDRLADIYASSSPFVERRAWAKTVIAEINREFGTAFGVGDSANSIISGVNA